MIRLPRGCIHGLPPGSVNQSVLEPRATRPKASPRHRRNGFTLLELVGVMAVAVIVLTLASQWLHHTLVYSSTIRQQQHYHQTLARLATSLRWDIRQASSIAVEGQTLTLEGIAAEYEIQEQQLIRRQTVDGQVALEVFPLMDSAAAQWDVAEMPQWVTLRIGRKVASEAPLLQDLRVRSGPLRQTTEIAGAGDQP